MILSCADNIDCSTRNKFYDDYVLKSMSEQDIYNLFNKHKIIESNNILCLTFPDDRQELEFICVSDKPCAFNTIIDLPTNVSAFASS